MSVVELNENTTIIHFIELEYLYEVIPLHNRHNHRLHHKLHKHNINFKQQLNNRFHPQSYYYPDIYNRLNNCTNLGNFIYLSNCLTCLDIASSFFLMCMFSLFCISCCKTKKKQKKLTVINPVLKQTETKHDLCISV
jgi:hypothetical protein